MTIPSLHDYNYFKKNILYIYTTVAALSTERLSIFINPLRNCYCHGNVGFGKNRRKAEKYFLGNTCMVLSVVALRPQLHCVVLPVGKC